MNNNDFSILLKAVLDKKNINTELKQVQEIVKKHTISVMPALKTASLRNQFKEVSQEIANDFNRTFNTNLNSKDVFKAFESQSKKMIAAEKEHQKYKENFLKQNLNGIDLEIKKREEANRRFTQMLKSQMQAQQRIDKERQRQHGLLQKKAATLPTRASQIATNITTGKYTSRASYLSNKANQWQSEKISMQGVNSALSNLNATYQAYNATSGKTAANQERLIAAEKTLNTEFQKVENSIKRINSTYMKSSNVDNLRNKIQKFYDINSGTHGIYGNDLQSLIAQLGQGMNVPLEKGKQIEQQFVRIQNLSRQQGLLGKSFKDKLVTGMQKFAFWTSSTAIIMRTVYQVREAITFTKELDSALANIHYTMDVTQNDLTNIGHSSISMAKDLKTSTKNVLEAVTLYANAKETVDSILEKSKTALMLGNVSGMSGGESAQTLQSVMNQFDLTQKDLLYISDTVQKVSQNMAYDFGKGIREIASGIERSGSVAKQAGLDLAEYSSMLGLVIEKTGLSGDTVGTAYRTILTRITKASSTSGTTDEEISKAEGALRGVGVEVRKNATEFREMRDILKDLGAVWDNLSDVQKSNISFEVAGTRQTNIIKTLLGYWDEYESLVSKAKDADGTTLANQEKYANTLKARQEELSTTMQSMWHNIIGADEVGGVIDVFQSLARVLDSLTSKLGSISTLIAGFAIYKAVKNTSFLNASLNGTNLQLSIFGKNIKHIQADMANGRGFFGSVFGGNRLNKTDIQAVQNYVSAVNSGVKPAKAMHDNLLNASNAAKSYVVNSRRAGLSTDELAAGLQRTSLSSKLAAFGINTLNIAVNALIGLGIGFALQAIIQGVTALAHRTENLKQSISDNTDTFKTLTDEIADLEKQLAETSDKIKVLQQLANDKTISLADEAELEKLKETNKELERKIGLKQADRAIAQRDIIEDSQKLIGSKRYSGYSYDNGKVSLSEHLSNAISKYIEISGRDTWNGWSQNDKKRTLGTYSNEIERTYSSIRPVIEAYEALMSAGIDLTTEEQTQYNELKKGQDAFLLYSYSINKTAESFRALTFEQKKAELSSRLKGKGIADSNYINAIFGAVGKDNIDKLWDKDIDFALPKNYSNAEEYGKAFAKAWLGGFSSEINKSDSGGIGELSLSKLKTSAENVANLAKGFKEFSKEGAISLDTLIGIKSALGEGFANWDYYQEKLMGGSLTAQEMNSIMNDLTYAMLVNSFTTKGLADADVKYVEQILKENGVLNANEVAINAVEKAKLSLKVQSLSTTDSIDTFISGLINEGINANLTKLEIIDLIASQIRFNNTNLDVGQKIQALQSLAIQAGIAKSAVDGIFAVGRTSGKSDKESWAKANGVQIVGDSQNRTGTNSKGQVFEYKDYMYDGVRYDTVEDAQMAIVQSQIGDMASQALSTVPKYSTGKSGGGGKKGGGGGSKSTKNDALEKYLKNAERQYKVHQNETKYINDLDYALNNLVKTEEERVNVLDKIEEARKNAASNAIDDIKHQIYLNEQLNGENANSVGYYKQIQKIASDEANRLRSIGYDNNSKEVQEQQKIWWDAEKNIKQQGANYLEEYLRQSKEAYEFSKDELKYINDLTWGLNNLAKTEEERLKIQKEIREVEKSYMEDQLSDIDSYISRRNKFGDWSEFGDVEENAIKRKINIVNEYYRKGIIGLEEYNERILKLEEDIYEVEKSKVVDKLGFKKSQTDSLKTLLNSYYDISNKIREEQHNINKELETSKTMYEYLDKETRQLLFNQDDFNALNDKLIEIQEKANKLQQEYKEDILGASKNDIEEITAQYQMQYETLMKSYEIAKSDLEIAKKKQQLNNVLKERNVRMFLNGSWQWVANSDNVIKAKNELADAEYAKTQAMISKVQTDNLNSLTQTSNELTTIINDINDGLVDFDVGLSELSTKGIPGLGGVLNQSAKIISKFVEDLTLKRVDTPVSFSKDIDYSKEMQKYPVGSEAWNYLNRKRNAKIGYFNLPYKKFAMGTNHTGNGLMQIGERGFEAFVNSDGNIIPVNSPTFVDSNGKGMVFNESQLNKLSSLWSIVSTPGFYSGTGNQTSGSITYDNRIVINGMTVDNGSASGKELVNAIRRYVSNH